MNKKRQMRWSPNGAHQALQVRATVADDRLKQAKLALAACPPPFAHSLLQQLSNLNRNAHHAWRDATGKAGNDQDRGDEPPLSP